MGGRGGWYWPAGRNVCTARKSVRVWGVKNALWTVDNRKSWRKMGGGLKKIHMSWRKMQKCWRKEIQSYAHNACYCQCFRPPMMTKLNLIQAELSLQQFSSQHIRRVSRATTRGAISKQILINIFLINIFFVIFMFDAHNNVLAIGNGYCY